METWDAIRARRAIREYDNTPIEDRDLVRILEAGRRAPSSRNDQRWDFVLIQDRDALEKISHVWRGAGHIADARAAVGLVAPTSEDPREIGSINYDLGQAAMSMMIAAADLGIGSRTASVHDYELAAEILGLPSRSTSDLAARARLSRRPPVEPDREACSPAVR